MIRVINCYELIFLNNRYSHLAKLHSFLVLSSDPAIKQFLLHLDETLKLGRKFIIQDLDETHLFISADILETLQAKIDDLMDQISFPITERGT